MGRLAKENIDKFEAKVYGDDGLYRVGNEILLMHDDLLKGFSILADELFGMTVKAEDSLITKQKYVKIILEVFDD
jgi:hypothetical protein